jgi:hypothetical protein
MCKREGRGRQADPDFRARFIRNETNMLICMHIMATVRYAQLAAQAWQEAKKICVVFPKMAARDVVFQTR